MANKILSFENIENILKKLTAKIKEYVSEVELEARLTDSFDATDIWNVVPSEDVGTGGGGDGTGGTSNYNDLYNLPRINGVTLSGNLASSDIKVADATHKHAYNDLTGKPTIPTKLSDLENDVGFVTDINADDKADKEHTHEITDVTDLASILADKADKTELHTHNNKSVLDSITQYLVNTWNNKSNFSGYYDDLLNKPTLPTKVSDLENDAEYQTKTEVDEAIVKITSGGSIDLSNYVTDEELNAKISPNMFIYGGCDYGIDEMPSIYNRLGVWYKGYNTNAYLDNHGLLSVGTNTIETEHWYQPCADYDNGFKANTPYTLSFDINIPTNSVLPLETLYVFFCEWNPSLSKYEDTKYPYSEWNVISQEEGSTWKRVSVTHTWKYEVDYDYRYFCFVFDGVAEIRNYFYLDNLMIEQGDTPSPFQKHQFENIEINKADKEHGHDISDVVDLQSTLDAKALKTELHSHDNKTVLDGITSTKVTEWDNKSTFSGNYNDLTNKPTIPNISGLATTSYVDTEVAKKADATHTHAISDVTNLQTTLDAKALKTELHSHSNKNVLDGITSSKVTVWDNKSDFSGSYNDLTNKPSIPTNISELNNDRAYQTKSDVDTAIANAVTGGTIDLSGYTTDEELAEGLATKANATHTHGISDVTNLQATLDAKALKTELHSHNNKTVLDNITSTKITEWDNKSNFSGDYDDLTNKPTIPSISGLATTSYVDEEVGNKADKDHIHAISDVTNLQTTLDTKALKTELHSHSNKTVLDGITSTKVTEWDNKSNFSGNYNDLTNKPTIPSINGLATTNYVNTEVAKKADKTHTHAISEVTNLQTTLDAKALKTELHSHSNKTVLDGITSTKITEWDNKSTFSGNYNDLTNKPTIPSISGLATTNYVNTEVGKKAEKEHEHTIDEITDLKLTTASDVDTIWNES